MKCTTCFTRPWMSALLLCLLMVIEPSHSGSALASSAPRTRPRATTAALVNIPLSFEENAGQTASEVRFLARTGRYQVYLTKDGAVLEARGNDHRRSFVRTSIIGANPRAEIRGIEKQHGVTNYLVGSPSEWKTAVPNYSKVRYSGVYGGIDLVYYGRQQCLEYDFNVAPQADPSQIRFGVEGANKISVDKEGALVLETSTGSLRWKRPVAYQLSPGSRRLVSASYQVSGNTVFFDLGSYDRSRALVIDPVLDYGTYLGGSFIDVGGSLFVDSAGFAYILGLTSSPDFPTTPGVYQTQNSTHQDQTFVTKLSQDGSSLVWSTIVGGSGPYNESIPSGFAVDRTGNIFIVGSTDDRNFSSTTQTNTYYPSTYPTTPGAYNSNHVPTQVYFLTKLNASGSALDYSTFLASQPNLQGYAVALDPDDNAYVAGLYRVQNSLSAPFPCTSGAFQCNYGGKDDAFVMKFNAQGTALDYATLVGGSETEDAYAITVNSQGEATISGPTYSTDYPITANGLRQTDEGGFVTTLNSAGTGLIYSTVLNHVFQIQVKRDTNGDYYVGGSTGTDLPITPNAYQKAFPGVGPNVHLGFLTVIDTSGNLVYSSYFGGNLGAGQPPIFGGYEFTGVQLVSPTDVTVTGYRRLDPSFPVTDRTYEQDTCDFLARFNPRASSGAASLLYSGCTPINETNNLYVEPFRGEAVFLPGGLYVDEHNNLYDLNNAGPTSSNAFQQLPKSSNPSFQIWLGKYSLQQPGPGGINLSAPFPQFFFSAPPAQYVYRATASSPQCPNGIAAMRVYISPGVAANTTLGPTLNATVVFPTNANYNTVIVAYDNCGNAFTKNVLVSAFGTSGVMGSIGITSPVDRTLANSPVHYVAKAEAPACADGIAAMRIYTAPGVAAYTVTDSSLDAYVNLSPGDYNTVVQAWDNCGHVLKAPVNITVQ